MKGTNRAVKILVVDDQPEAVQGVCAFLQASGYLCIPAHTSVDALERFQTDAAIGLVLCELRMPELDGIELIRALKGVAGPQRPFESILLTTHANKRDVIRALREGFADYYEKPIVLPELLDAVQRQEAALLERQRNVEELGTLNQRLQDLAESIDDLYHDLEKARGQGPYRRATDVLPETPDDKSPAIFDKLSPRQLEVAKLVSQGKTNYQVACELGITENTVKLYVSQVLRLTHMHNRTQLALAFTPHAAPLHQRFAAH